MTDDNILDLDEFLAGDIRLAERTARFLTRPDLEADIEVLEAQLAETVQTDDKERAETLAARIRDLRSEMQASMRSIRLRQLNGDEWTTFRVKWKAAMEKAADGELPSEMWDDLVSACAIAPTLNVDQVGQLAGRIGYPQLDHIRLTAWRLNTSAGVEVPRSLLSLSVLQAAEDSRAAAAAADAQ